MGDIGKIIKSLGFIEEFIAVTGSLSTERNVINLLKKVVVSALRFTHCDGGRIYMLDVTRRNLQLKVSVWQEQDTSDEWFDELCLVDSERISASADPLVYSMLTGNTLIVDDLAREAIDGKERHHQHDELNNLKTHSFILVPLINHEDQIIGLLELLNARDPVNHRFISFRPLEPVIKAFSSQAAICINNTLLIDNNRKLIDILDSSNQLLEEDNKRLRGQRTRSHGYQIIGRSEPITQVFALMDKVVESDVTVLLRGETGTGKEVFAREIHKHSMRSQQPFVTQNCAALPEHLLESELFGYKKGAFTGAVGEKKGLFDVANGGTLFLDEIGDMPVSLQSKLLRVIQEGEVRPLGATKSHRIDVRIIAATHCELEQSIRDGKFREDLFFRLSVFPLELPTLRERGMDIVLLAEYFVAQSQKQYQRRIRGISPAALELLLNYRYPGNVRELQNILERAALLCEDGGFILPEHLPSHVRVSTNQLLSTAADSDHPSVDKQQLILNKPLKQAVNDYECAVIRRHLKHHNWNQTQTAKALQIPRRTLIDKMNRFSIRTPERRSS